MWVKPEEDAVRRTAHRVWIPIWMAPTPRLRLSDSHNRERGAATCNYAHNLRAEIFSDSFTSGEWSGQRYREEDIFISSQTVRGEGVYWDEYGPLGTSLHFVWLLTVA